MVLDLLCVSWVQMKMGLGLTGKLGHAWVGAWVPGSVHGYWLCDDVLGGGGG